MTQLTGEQGRGVGGTNSRVAAWLAWALVVLSVVLLVGGLVLSRAASSTVADLQFGGETKSANVLADLVTLLIFSVVGAVVVSRQPRNTIGWLFCGVGVAVGLNSFAGDYAEFWLMSGFGMRSLGETAAWFSSWLWILLVSSPTSLLLLLFPDGRLPSPRWRPVAWGVALGTAGGVVGNALKAGPLVDFPQIANPYGVDGPFVWVLGVAGSIVARAPWWRPLSRSSFGCAAREASNASRSSGSLAGARWSSAPSSWVAGHSLERAGQYRDYVRRLARVAGLHGHCDREVPPLRHRPPHKPYPGLRFAHADARACVLRGRNCDPGSLPNVNRPAEAAPTGGCGLHARDSSAFQPLEAPYSILHR